MNKPLLGNYRTDMNPIDYSFYDAAAEYLRFGKAIDALLGHKNLADYKGIEIDDNFGRKKPEPGVPPYDPG
jgi:hypothetical protein